MRRVGEPPKSNQKYRIRPGAYVIAIRNGDVLLTHQSDPEPEFQLPGGGIDPGESPLQALYRETLEETGWRIAKLLRLGAFRRYVYMPEYKLFAEKVCHIYVAEAVRLLHEPTEPGHHAVWCNPEIAADLVGNPGDAAYLRHVFGLPDLP